MKKIIVAITIIIILGLAGFFLAQLFDQNYDSREPISEEPQEEQPQENTQEQVNDTETVIATSVEGRDVKVHHYGQGETNLLLIGGIHGGYEWNTVILAREIMSHLEENPDIIPENVRVSVIPVLNPDGLAKTVGTDGEFSASDVSEDEDLVVEGRFNGNNVDLNRNFDCDWEPVGVWRSTEVDGGTEAFSEPESRGLKNYIENNRPNAVIIYNSAANGVFASNCHNGVLDETIEILNVYADASGYPAYEDFDFYEITGDAINWLAKIEIPAISVLLSKHQSIEWNKNRAGIEAILEHYGSEE